MCGRYQLGNLANHEIAELVGHDVFEEHGPSMPGLPFPLPLWNIAPTQRAPVLRAGPNGGRELVALRWGLVPAWAPDLKFGARTINARSEEAATKPSFRSAWKARRCLVPATGFYEWMAGTKPKRPFLFRPADGSTLTFAGLWESWTDKGTGEIVETYTILTRAPYAAVQPVHDRSPLVLPRDRWDGWLDPAVKDPVPVLASTPEPELVAREVETSINAASWENPPVER